MISIECRKWYRNTHVGSKEEADYVVLLEGLPLATFSTYTTDVMPKGDPKLAAKTYAKKVAKTLLDRFDKLAPLTIYIEHSQPFKEAEQQLNFTIAQLRGACGKDDA